MKALKACKSITNEKEWKGEQNLEQKFFSILAASTRENSPPFIAQEKKYVVGRKGERVKVCKAHSKRIELKSHEEELKWVFCVSYHHKREIAFKFMRLTRKQKCLKEDMEWQERLHSAFRKLLCYELHIYTSWRLILVEKSDWGSR